jgi:hypothetical protein
MIINMLEFYYNKMSGLLQLIDYGSRDIYLPNDYGKSWHWVKVDKMKYKYIYDTHFFKFKYNPGNTYHSSMEPSFEDKIKEFDISPELLKCFQRSNSKNYKYILYKYLIKSELKKLSTLKDKTDNYDKIVNKVDDIVFMFPNSWYTDDEKRIKDDLENERKYVLQKEQLHKELIEKFWAPSKYDIWWNEDMG